MSEQENTPGALHHELNWGEEVKKGLKRDVAGEVLNCKCVTGKLTYAAVALCWFTQML